jgi:hypothetical protein
MKRQGCVWSGQRGELADHWEACSVRREYFTTYAGVVSDVVVEEMAVEQLMEQQPQDLPPLPNMDLVLLEQELAFQIQILRDQYAAIDAQHGMFNDQIAGLIVDKHTAQQTLLELSNKSERLGDQMQSMRNQFNALLLKMQRMEQDVAGLKYGGRMRLPTKDTKL